MYSPQISVGLEQAMAAESIRPRMKSIHQRRISVRQRLYASYFGSQRPKYFLFGSAVDEQSRNKLYGVILSAGFTYLAACLAHALGVAPDSHFSSN